MQQPERLRTGQQEPARGSLIADARKAPPLGYFHVRKPDLHPASALQANPSFESFDVVLRRDFDRLAARLAAAEAKLWEADRIFARFDRKEKRCDWHSAFVETKALVFEARAIVEGRADV